MAVVNWTENQRMAIDAKGTALLVSAAAGSGKTAVLVERVIEMITDRQNPIDADRLLIVTYTRAAAAEMRQRISDKLNTLIEENPYDDLLHRQLTLLEKATISTIHSFCAELARDNFYRLDINADFRIADDAELKIIKRKALDDVLNEMYESGQKSFFELVEAFSSVRDDSALQGIILKLHGFLLSHPFPEKWLKSKAEMYNSGIPAEQTVWGKSLIAYARDAVDYCLTLTNASLALAADDDRLFNAFSKQLYIDKGFFETLKGRLEHGNWNGIAELAQSFENGRLTPPKGYKDDPTKLKISANRDIVKKAAKDLKSLFAFTREDCEDDIAALSPVVQSLFDTVQRFSDRFAQMKREADIADFSDLEHFALKLLVKPDEQGYSLTEVAYNVRDCYDEVMVDEYQDVNEVQDIIFSAVSRDESNLFVVGDVKQSIYRFRQAMPEIFLRRKGSLEKYRPNENNNGAKIILDKNFRSREGITDAVNFVFEHLMSEKAGDMEYSDEEKLTAGAVYPENDEPATELHLLDLGDSGLDMNTAEARYIADIIHSEMKNLTVTDGDIQRPATYGDFCILLRNANKHAPDFVKELGLLGIPASSEASEKFLSTYEVSVIISLLSVIDNPIQDIPLLAVMTSPIYGFTPDELAVIRLNNRRDKLYFAVKTTADMGDRRCIGFLNDLDSLRRAAATTPSDLLINAIYEKTGFTAIVRGMKNGEARLNNLRLLQEYARGFEESGYKGLSGFMGLINRLISQGGDLPAASDSKLSSINTVKIMSIHKSKGLEFPICIVANLSRKMLSDKTDDVLLHAELGLGVKRRDNRLMCKYNTMPRQAVALEIERGEKSEELRVLYVAMTRAKEKLIMISSVKNHEKYLCDLSATLTGNSRLSPYTVLGAKSMSDWVVSCAMMHKSGSLLREIAGNSLYVPPADNAMWKIKIHKCEPDTDDKNQQTEQPAESEEYSDTVLTDTVRARLEKPYQFAALGTLPVKVAASALAAESSDEDYRAASRPAFMREGGMTPTEKGTALHNFMQYADFKRAAASVDDELKRLEENGFLSKNEFRAVDRDSIRAFLNSELMDRINRSQKLYREFRFTVKIKAGRVDPSLPPPLCGRDIILQGAVDLAFEENGTIVIVDYKTDRIKEINELKSRYSTQLLLYKEAMEQCTELPLAQCILYSLRLGEWIDVG